MRVYVVNSIQHHLYANKYNLVINNGAEHSNQPNHWAALPSSIGPSLALWAIHLVLRLRRVNHMCSSTVSDTANMLRNIRKKKSSAVLLFGAVAGLRSAPD